MLTISAFYCLVVAEWEKGDIEVVGEWARLFRRDVIYRRMKGGGDSVRDFGGVIERSGEFTGIGNGEGARNEDVDEKKWELHGHRIGSAIEQAHFG